MRRGRRRRYGSQRACACERRFPPDPLSTEAEMARLKLTLVLNSGARIGPGKAALLESVHATGSISAAARTMSMDYKRT